MNTINDLKNELALSMVTLRSAKAKVKELESYVKHVRAELKTERSIERVVREDQKRLRAEKREAKNAERIAKLEQKLLALKSPKALKKAARKPSDVKVLVENGKVAA